MRDCSPRAHSASSWSPERPRCAVVGRHLGGARRVPDLPGLRTIVEWSRIGRAGFVGLRSFPSTLAPATLVVLVITEFAADVEWGCRRSCHSR